MIENNSFINKLSPVVKKDSGLILDNYIVWGSSVIKGEDGRYHMFSSRWPNAKGSTWSTDSTIIRSVADTPEGPFEFAGLAVTPRGEGYWDGSVTHNPTIHKHKDTYVMFYIGSHYTDKGDSTDIQYQALKNKRIGIATSKSVLGPWERYDQPIIEPRPGKWDAVMTSNPAAYIEDDGSVLLVYKSWPKHERINPNGHRQLIGVARAPHFLGPYERIRDERIFSDHPIDFNSEDMYIWKQDGIYHMIAKMFAAGETLLGETNAGYYATSNDGIDWQLSETPKAYSRTIQWDDGTSTTFNRAERSQLLIQDGKPTHLYQACLKRYGTDNHISHLKDTHQCICIPFKDI